MRFSWVFAGSGEAVDLEDHPTRGIQIHSIWTPSETVPRRSRTMVAGGVISEAKLAVTGDTGWSLWRSGYFWYRPNRIEVFAEEQSVLKTEFPLLNDRNFKSINALTILLGLLIIIMWLVLANIRRRLRTR